MIIPTTIRLIFLGTALLMGAVSGWAQSYSTQFGFEEVAGPSTAAGNQINNYTMGPFNQQVTLLGMEMTVSVMTQVGALPAVPCADEVLVTVYVQNGSGSQLMPSTAPGVSLSGDRDNAANDHGSCQGSTFLCSRIEKQWFQPTGSAHTETHYIPFGVGISIPAGSSIIFEIAHGGSAVADIEIQGTVQYQ